MFLYRKKRLENAPGLLDRFLNAFVRLTDRLDRAVFVEEHLVHADRAASERAAFAVDFGRLHAAFSCSGGKVRTQYLTQPI